MASLAVQMFPMTPAEPTYRPAAIAVRMLFAH